MTKSTTKYLIDGKKVDLTEFEEVYSDGHWSDRGERLFHRKEDGLIVLEEWTNWQNEHDDISVLTEENAREYLLKQDHHPERALEALEKLGLEVDKL